MTQYDISPKADADMDEIWTYIAERNFQAAERLVRGLVSKFEMLSRQPLIGESVGNMHPGLRRVLFGNYVVYYEIVSERVTIRRVIHSARDISRIFGPDE